jgi:hypothetical protein
MVKDGRNPPPAPTALLKAPRVAGLLFFREAAVVTRCLLPLGTEVPFAAYFPYETLIC